MSIYNTVSAQETISRVYRDLQIDDTNWEVDAIEWIGHGLDLMGGTMPTEKRQEVHAVESHKLALPSDMALLEGLFLLQNVDFHYSGSTLVYNEKEAQDAPKYRVPREGNTQLTQEGASPLHDGIGDKKTDRAYQTASESYELNPGTIHTSFERGLVIVAYKGFATDEKGYPLVPDDARVKEALFWRIVMKLILRGYNHPKFGFKAARQQWKDYAAKARRKSKMPDPDEYDHFMRSWVRFVNNRWKGSTGTGKGGGVYGQDHMT